MDSGDFQHKDAILPVEELPLSYHYNGNCHTKKDGLYIETGLSSLNEGTNIPLGPCF